MLPCDDRDYDDDEEDDNGCDDDYDEDEEHDKLVRTIALMVKMATTMVLVERGLNSIPRIIIKMLLCRPTSFLGVMQFHFNLSWPLEC